MATAPEKLDAAFYADLGVHNSVVEIVDLSAFVGFNIGFHTYFGALNFFPMFTPDCLLVNQAESRRIYGDHPVAHQTRAGLAPAAE